MSLFGICLILLLVQTPFTYGEVFTALVDLEKLLYTEGELIKSLREYVDTETERLRTLQG